MKFLKNVLTNLLQWAGTINIDNTSTGNIVDFKVGGVSKSVIDTNGKFTGGINDNISTQKVNISKAGTSVGTRKQLNLIEGTNVTLTMADNAGSDRVDVTIAASGTGGMVYPGAGVPVSTGSAWSTSLTAPTSALVGISDTQTLSGKTLTTPKIAASGYIADANGHEIFAVGAIKTSPVNFLGVLNNTTGLAPYFFADGDDAVVDIGFVTKGGGNMWLNGVDIPTISSTDTLTNKRVNPRILSASSTPVSINSDNYDVVTMTGFTGAITINDPTGTPVDGQRLTFYLRTGAGTATITWGWEKYMNLSNSFPAGMGAASTVVIEAVYTSLYDFWYPLSVQVGSSTYVFDNITQTLTNKRITKRVYSEASNAAPATNTDSYDMHCITALAVGTVIGAPTGTPTNGQELMYRIKDSGTSQTIGWNAIFRAIGIVLPLVTATSKTMYVKCIYNSTDSKWDVLSIGQE